MDNSRYDELLFSVMLDLDAEEPPQKLEQKIMDKISGNSNSKTWTRTISLVASFLLLVISTIFAAKYLSNDTINHSPPTKQVTNNVPPSSNDGKAIAKKKQQDDDKNDESSNKESQIVNGNDETNEVAVDSTENVGDETTEEKQKPQQPPKKGGKDDDKDSKEDNDKDDEENNDDKQDDGSIKEQQYVFEIDIAGIKINTIPGPNLISLSLFTKDKLIDIGIGKREDKNKEESAEDDKKEGKKEEGEQEQKQDGSRIEDGNEQKPKPGEERGKCDDIDNKQQPQQDIKKIEDIFHGDQSAKPNFFDKLFKPSN